MPACPTLTTERLVLRPFRADDLESFHAAMTTDEVRASLDVPHDYSPGETWRSMCTFAGLWDLRGLGQWALEELATGRFVGRAGLYWRVDDDWPGVEVGWMLDPAVWSSGYATEAGARSVRYGFEVLGEDTLYCMILPGNTRSEAVARRLGFEAGAERTMSFFPSRPHVVWHLDRPGWESGLNAG